MESHKVVMLASSNTKAVHNQLEYYSQYNSVQVYKSGSTIGEAQDLHILSNDINDLENGDIVLFYDRLVYCVVGKENDIISLEYKNNTKIAVHKDCLEKIIYTTDESLGLPIIPLEFLEYFCENRMNTIMLDNEDLYSFL